MSDFTMPSLGADMESGTLLEWLVHPGDHVHRGDPMAVVDTDKAAIEVESFQDGVVGSFLVEPGTRVAVGTPLATVLSAEDAAVPAPPPAGAAAEAPGRVSPYARKLAHQLGVDLATVHHTGPRDYVNAEDVREAARALAAAPAPAAPSAPAPAPAPTLPAAPAAPAVSAAPAAPAPPPAPAAPAPAPRTGRSVVAALMSRSKREIPHYYVATTVDLHAAVSWIQRTNRDRAVTERLVPAAVLLRATALAVRRMPELNGFWVDGAFVPGEDVHLGVAVSVRGGALVAPALHGAADLDLPTTMARLRDLVTRARTGRLTRAEMADPTLTVTDLGDQGVEEVIGVIQPPQVALVGVGRVVERPWAVDGMLAVRPVVRLTLSGDHRATDGYTGARFLRLVDDLLQRPEEL